MTHVGTAFLCLLFLASLRFFAVGLFLVIFSAPRYSDVSALGLEPYEDFF
jgi:hypothetical protein